MESNDACVPKMALKKRILNRIVGFCEQELGERLYRLDEVEGLLKDLVNASPVSIGRSDAFSPSYYQKLHGENEFFAENNWLMEDLDVIASQEASTIAELACGNGQFSRAISTKCNQVFAIDWAVSDRVDALPENVKFLQRDISVDPIPQSDLVCSGDFLEHLPPDTLRTVISKAIESAPRGYHKIACYDDGHSHLSVFPPWRWLAAFQEIDSTYRIRELKFRHHRLDRLVVVVSNF